MDFCSEESQNQPGLAWTDLIETTYLLDDDDDGPVELVVNVGVDRRGGMKNEYDDVSSDWEINDFRMVIIAGTDRKPASKLRTEPHIEWDKLDGKWIANDIIKSFSSVFQGRKVMSF